MVENYPPAGVRPPMIVEDEHCDYTASTQRWQQPRRSGSLLLGHYRHQRRLVALDEFDHDAVGVAGMQEGYQRTVRAGSWLRIDRREPGEARHRERMRDVADRQGDVVKTFAAPLQEPRGRTVLPERLDQLDPGRSHGDECDGDTVGRE